MNRTHNCGELTSININQKVTLCGWVQTIRNKGGLIWVDLRDRYGVTQLIFQKSETDESIFERATTLSREYVIQVEGIVTERSSKNEKISTGEIEISVEDLTILNESKVPPFTIEDQTDGGEELRMKYRYLDIRRNKVLKNLILRAEVVNIFRSLLLEQNFLEVETPYLIKSTPEGARDFLVPSRMNKGKFYALPQSPQTFKQLLMIGGCDKYFQLVKCFRDEDLRADRQPEFSQLDCEMSFVGKNDVMSLFENVIRQIFKSIKQVSLPKFPIYSYEKVMELYGTDKPDLRYEMPICTITDKANKCNFEAFDKAETIAGICIKGASNFTRRQIDDYTNFVKEPQLRADGLIYVKYNEDGTMKSSIDKFFSNEQIINWFEDFNAEKGDILFIIAGSEDETRVILGTLRQRIARDLNLIDKNKFAPLWVVEFPLIEYSDELDRYVAVHHPFTAPMEKDINKLLLEPHKVKSEAYDLVINGYEVAGGSIRIHKKSLQQKIFETIGMSKREYESQFGFLLDALEFGAPPHGGIAFGIARLCAILGGSDAIRDFIAFPKNNAGKDVMIDAPAEIDQIQLKELRL